MKRTLSFAAAAMFLALFGISIRIAHAQFRTRPDAGSEHFITVSGVQRRYLLHLPPNSGGKQPAPLILMLHGGGGSADNADVFRIAEAADPKGFIVVYPDGKDHGWNDGRIIKRHDQDDVGFISALIDELVKKQNVDPKRVYVTGMSNGGFMSFTLACRLSDKIAAIAPVAGSMGVGSFDDCKPTKPISVLMINGTKDPIVHFEGGPVLRNRGVGEPVDKIVEFWRAQECGGARPPIKFKRVSDNDPDDESTATAESITCPGGEVVNYTVEGGGHTWPGGKQYMFRAAIGSVNRDFDASQTIVEFFSRH